MSTGNHRETCEIVADYRRREGAILVLVEPHRSIGTKGEKCDVYPLFPKGRSVVDEIKLSVSDYKADAGKPHIIGKVPAMGVYRNYVCPEGVVETYQAEERGHGLNWIEGVELIEVVPAPQRHRINLLAERELLARHIESLYFAERGEAVAGRIGGGLNFKAGKTKRDPVEDRIAQELEATEATAAQLVEWLGLDMTAPALAKRLRKNKARFGQRGAGGNFYLLNDEKQAG